MEILRLNNKNGRLSIMVAGLSLVLLVLAVFSNLYAKEAYLNLFLSSDALYLPSVYSDIIVNGGAISSWHLNPAPNFFPDMLIYFIFMFVTNSFFWSTLLFSIFQYLTLAFLMVWLFNILFPKKSYFYRLSIIILFSVFTLEFLYFSHDLGYTFLVLINSYHMGSFLSALLGIIVSLKFLINPKKSYLLFLFLLVLLAVFSDRLFIILFTLPLLITVVLLYKQISRGQLFSLATVIVFATSLGHYLFSLINRNTYELFRSSQVLDADLIYSSWTIFIEHMTLVFSSVGFKGFSFYLLLVSFILIGVTVIRSYREKQNVVLLFSIFSIVFTCIVVFAPIVNGLYSDYSCLRYNMFPVFLAGINTMVFIASHDISGAWKGKGRYTFGLLTIMLLMIAIISIKPAGLKAYFNYYPETVKIIDEMCVRENLREGVGNYWIAKKVTMFSRADVKIRAVFDDIAVFDHVSNDDWYFNKIFTFVVLNNFNDTSLYRSKLKNLRTVRYDDKLRLLQASPFTFKRESGYRVQNIGFKEQ